MKKSIFGKALALLAAGAMAFTAIGCDSGNDIYKTETPTTYKLYSTSGNGDCTAKWTFATDTSGIGKDEVAWEKKEIKPDSGEGATLIGGNAFPIKYVAPEGAVTEDMGKSAGRIQASNKTASLASPDSGPCLILETKEQTNITVRAKGAGAATPARILAIKDPSGEIVVSKDNLFSAGSTFIAFHLQGAPKGKYTIYFNGSTISEIDCNATGNTVAQPKAYVKNEDLKIQISKDGKTKTDFTKGSGTTIDPKESIEAFFLTLADSSGTDVTASAAWDIIEGKEIATVKAGAILPKDANSKGKVRVRARMGMFYVDSEYVEFTPTSKSVASTFVASNLPEAKTEILDWSTNGEDAQKVLATKVIGQQFVEITDETATIKIADVLKTIVAKGKGTYTLNDKNVYTLEKNEKEENPSEFWTIKDVSAQNGGVSIKDGTDSTESTEEELTSPKEWFSLSYKVKPVAGKNVKITGLRANFNCGAGANKWVLIDVYKGTEKIGTIRPTKGGVIAAITTIATPISLSGEDTFTFTVAQDRLRPKGKGGVSMQLDDLGLVCEVE